MITQSTWAKAVWPGVNTFYGQTYNEYKPEYTDIFETNTSRRAYEEDVGTSGFGLPSVIDEGGGVTFDTQAQGFTSRYTHVRYGLGFIVTKIAFDDDLYQVVGAKRAKALAMSMRQAKDTVGANVLNRAFNSSYTFGDGIQLISTANVNVAGGTWSNRLATDAVLSEAALEQMLINMSNATNDRGLRIKLVEKALLIPTNLQFEAARILDSQYRVGTAENDINVLNATNRFPMGVKINHYFTSTTAWFVKSSATDGLKYFSREDDRFEMDNDFDTDNAKFKATARYSFGCSDKRSIWGTSGA